MIKNGINDPQQPSRVVILGGSGFIGRYLAKQLAAAKVPVLSLASRDLDLTAPESAAQLTEILDPNDAVVFTSCLTPDKGKDIRTTMKNLEMGENVCAALAQSPAKHMIYISSDAVYADDEYLVRENSRCEPSGMYGLGHFTRERMIRDTCQKTNTPWLILRPTLVYGSGDTHNSYGPNRFARMAEQGKITLFGGGEEKRDHVHVEDVARLIGECLRYRAEGIANIATGASFSFMEVAKIAAGCYRQPVTIEQKPRSGPVTHRHFDVTNVARWLPTFRFTPLEMGLRISYGATAAAA